MRLHQIICEASDPRFTSLDAILVWAEKLGVTLDAKEHVHSAGSRYAGDISVIWIERRKKAPPGTGARVMTALCRYADAAYATMSLQADNEDVLPEYYEQFGFVVDKEQSNGDDVRPTGPDMTRLPKSKKAKMPLGSTVANTLTQSEPIGVAALHSWGQDKPQYFIVFDPKKIEKTKEKCENRVYDAEDVWVGYIVDTPEWSALKSKIGIRTEMHVPSSASPDPDDRKRWSDLYTKGKVVFRVNHNGDC